MERLEHPADRIHHATRPGWVRAPVKHSCTCGALWKQTVFSVSEWCPGSEGYVLSSRRNMALRNDSAQSRCPVIYSNTPSYVCGQTLTFK